MYVDNTNHSGPGFFNESFDRYLGATKPIIWLCTRRTMQDKSQSFIDQTILYPEQGRIGYHTAAQTFDGG